MTDIQARLMALAGAELLIYPTAIGYDPNDTSDEQQRQRMAWQTVQRGHAVANGLPVIAVNRVGFEPDPSGQTAGIQFWGTSFVCDFYGRRIAEAYRDRAEILYADCDLRAAEEHRRMWPFFRDRRIDAYENLMRRFND